MDRTPEEVKIGSLTPRSKNFSVRAKVLDVSEAREIPSKFGGETRRVAEATVGDESGNVVLSLWNEQIEEVNEGDSVFIENAYVTLLRGHIRLNVGKYGRIENLDEDVAADADNKNVSDEEHEDERRGRGGGGGGGGRGGGGGGGRGGYGGGGGRGGGGGGRGGYGGGGERRGGPRF